VTDARRGGGVVVTGASSGIGAAVVAELAWRGYRVFGTVRRDADRASLEAVGAIPIVMDVTDGEAVARARGEVERSLAGASLVGLVNNAGIGTAGPLSLLPLDELRRVLEVNLVGVLAVTQAFLPLLTAARGRIVNISSLAGRQALPFMGPYVASKYGLEGMSDCLRRELALVGVKVVVIEPGSVQSKIWDKVEALDISRYGGSVYAPILERFRQAALRGARRAPSAEIVARAVGRALEARRPPLRIVVAGQPILTRLMLRIPDRILDWLIARALRRMAARSERSTH